MASAAYAVVGCNVDVRVEVEVLDELAVVTSRVITHKAVKLLGYFEFVEYSTYDSALGSPSIVSKEVAEGD